MNAWKNLNLLTSALANFEDPEKKNAKAIQANAKKYFIGPQ